MKRLCFFSMMVLLLAACSNDKEFCNQLGKKSNATPDDLNIYAKKCLNPDASQKYP